VRLVTVDLPNKRFEFAPCGRMTRKGDAPLLAAKLFVIRR
jgi:hypothetical protein